MHIKVRSERDTPNEEEKGVEGVGSDHKERGDGEVFIDGGGDEVEEGEHGEDRDEHCVVYDRWVSRLGFGDHVARKGEDEESP